MGKDAAETETDQEQGLHRLLDMVVQEVSLVDRPANKRRFLVVKRADTMKTKKTDAATTTATTTATAADATTSTAETTTTTTAAEPAPKTRMTAATKASLSAAIAASAALLVAATKTVAEADVADDAGAPVEVVDLVLAAIKGAGVAASKAATEVSKSELTPEIALRVTIESVRCGLWEAFEEGPESAIAFLRSGADAIEAQLRGAPGATDQAAAAAMALDAAKTAATATAPAIPAAKAGRRMAKERLERFRKAFSLLEELLAELTAEEKAPAAEATPAAAPAAKADTSQAQVKDPVLVAEIATLRAQVAKQAADIATLRQTPPASNQRTVENAGGDAGEEADPWPLDMNRPITKRTVAPSRSFY